MTRIGTGRLLVLTLVAVIATECGGGDKKESAGSITSTTAAPTTATGAPTTTAPAVVTTAKPTTTTAKPITTTVPAKLSPTQFFIAKPGCTNEIDYVRVGADRKLMQSKVVVKAAGNSQLIAYAERNDKLLFGSFNCDAKTNSISEIGLTNTHAAPRVIATDLDVVDADYDIATNAVLVLTAGTSEAAPNVVAIDPDGTRTVRWTRPLGWNTSANPLGGYVFVHLLRALTGHEMMIGGDANNNKFMVLRVSADGSTSGGVTGDGKLGKFDISILEGAVALSIDKPPDLYVCAFSPVYGSGLSTPSPITSVPGCVGNPLPQALTSIPAKVAWAFSGQDGHSLLLAIRDQSTLLDVESLDLKMGSTAPPKIYGSAASDIPYAVYAVAVYVIEKDLSKTLPAVTV